MYITLPSIRQYETNIPFTATVYNADGSVKDITAATVYEFLLKTPAGVTVTLAGAISNGPGGQFQYISDDDDFDTEGTYTIQARCIVGGRETRSSVMRFSVDDSLEIV